MLETTLGNHSVYLDPFFFPSSCSTSNSSLLWENKTKQKKNPKQKLKAPLPLFNNTYL